MTNREARQGDDARSRIAAGDGSEADGLGWESDAQPPVEVGLRELNRETAEVMRWVRGGRRVIVSRHGRPFAVILPLEDGIEMVLRSEPGPDPGRTRKGARFDAETRLLGDPVALRVRARRGYRLVKGRRP